MTTSNYQLIPLSNGKKPIWVPCQTHTLLLVALGQLSQSELHRKSYLTEFLLNHPGLLVTFLDSVSSELPVDRESIYQWLVSGERANQFSQSRPSECEQVSGIRKLWKRVSVASSPAALSDAIEKFLGGFTRKRVAAKWCRNRFPLQIKSGLIRSFRKSARRLAAGKSKFPELSLSDAMQGLDELRSIRTEFDRRLSLEKLESMRLLAYGASHEINNPLANIATRAQSLLTEELDPKRRHRLSVIYEQAMRAHEMISDMMLFAHPPAVELKRIDLVSCTRQVVDELKSWMIRSSIQHEISAPESMPILGDETQIYAAIKSLVANSIEAIGEGGEIEVNVVREADNTVSWTLADDGPGIDPEIANNIFDPFFSGREAGRGLGFGLSKAWRIVQLHNAQIDRQTSKLGGAEFRIRFPATKEIELSIPSAEAEPKAA